VGLAAVASAAICLPAMAQETQGDTLVFKPLSPDFVPSLEAGEANFQTLCKGCHSASSLARGPSLKGVAGRRIASVRGFEYSEGLKARGRERWDDKTLDQFLAKPTDFAPGAKMTIWEPNPEARASMIAYLKTLK
jgi:cytochrome c